MSESAAHKKQSCLEFFQGNIKYIHDNSEFLSDFSSPSGTACSYYHLNLISNNKPSQPFQHDFLLILVLAGTPCNVRSARIHAANIFHMSMISLFLI